MNTFSTWLDRGSLWIALAAAWVATLGSLYFSEVAGFLPCTLCWYQRILMYPLALLLAVGLLRRDPHLPVLVLPFSLTGLGFATYHYLLEKTDIFGQPTACQAGVSCVTAWINWFGFVTIPFLALVGFLVITVMAAIAYNAGEPDPDVDAPVPWLPVGAIVGVFLLAYAGLAWANRPVQATTFIFPVADASAAAEQSRIPNPTTAAITDSVADSATEAELIATGARLYQAACAVCHGGQGEGVAGLGNALAHSEFVHGQTDAELAAFVRAGRAASDPANQSGIDMPPSGGRSDLTDYELLAIIHVLRVGFAMPEEPAGEAGQ